MAADFVVELMDGPAPLTFDCGRPEQNAFFHERAWDDQREQLSSTYLFHGHGVVAGFATVCLDGLPLDRLERGPRIRYKYVGAVKLAQLGVDRSFQGLGLGSRGVALAIGLARRVSTYVECRYVTLDAQPELEPWYARLGFVPNRLRQEERVRDAVSHGRDPSRIPISMRYDLRRKK